VWVIDDYAGKVVAEIFSRFIGGENCHTIAIDLNNRNVLPPNAYYQSEKGNQPNKNVCWAGRTIAHLLENISYIGTYVAGKYSTPSYKNHKQIIRPEDEWVVIENHHPASYTGV
jgi:hypothetical protein